MPRPPKTADSHQEFKSLPLPPPEDQILADEMAAILGISRNALYDMQRRGVRGWKKPGMGNVWIFSKKRAHELAASKVKYDAEVFAKKLAKKQEQADKVAQIQKRTSGQLVEMPNGKIGKIRQSREGVPRPVELRALIGVSDAARLLKTTKARVYARAYAGELRPVPRRGSTSLYFNREEIEGVAKDEHFAMLSKKAMERAIQERAERTGQAGQ